MKSGSATIFKNGKANTLYVALPSHLVSDSSFPFKIGEKVEIVIVGQKLEVRKK